MGSTTTKKAERRARRQAKAERRRRDGLTVQPFGAMDPDVLEQVTKAAAKLDIGAPWPTLAPTLLPVIKRVWHPYPPELSPVTIQVPPGIPVGFGIDFGPAFSHVTPAVVASWGVDHATLLATSLDNLRRLVVTEPPVVQRFAHDGVDIVAVQGMGWGSSLLLLPEVLAPILGTTPLVLLAPVRNTLLALPEDVEFEMAVDLWDAVTEGAHDELDVGPLRWTGRSVVSLADVSPDRVH